MQRNLPGLDWELSGGTTPPVGWVPVLTLAYAPDFEVVVDTTILPALRVQYRVALKMEVEGSRRHGPCKIERYLSSNKEVEGDLSLEPEPWKSMAKA